MKPTYALIIMDGFAWGKDGDKGNAVYGEGTPELKKLIAEYPATEIGASGLDVGLPDGQMGNSEVGHLNIGAGRIIYQDITKIDKAISDGDFYTNEALVGACDNCRKHGSKLHLIGLLSDGGVHSHINHLYALLELAKKQGVDKVYVHCLMDGRDVSPTSGAGFVRALQEKMTEIGVGHVASVVGRYYLMDRDNRWERVEQGFNCVTAGKGEQTADPAAYIESKYADGITDEFMTPAAVTVDGEIVGVDAHDSIVFFNFRSDRAREATRAFITPDFAAFERAKGYLPVHYVCMTQYDATFEGVELAFGPKKIDNTLGEWLAKLGKRQLRIAETEKYAHVTFFFNGGVETPNDNEMRILVPSPKVATYDLQPEMSAPEVTEKAVEAIRTQDLDIVILNFANCDMVGHTGVYEATYKAVETVDRCVKTVLDAVLATGGAAIVTADHGNAEQLLMPDGSPCTAHTTNKVPFILVAPDKKDAELAADGKLCDLAPSLLKLAGLDVPPEMTGKPLF